VEQLLHEAADRRIRMHPVRVFLAPGVAGLLLLASASAEAQLPAIQSATYVSGLSAPVGMVQDPSNPAVQYVVQQGGRIRVILNGALQGTDFINLTSSIQGGGERGLLGLAFPTDYARTGRFYVNFTRAGDGHTVIARFLRSAANALVADPNSRFDFLWPVQPDMATDNGCSNFASTEQRAICQPFSNHNGGKIAFGPDGYLYIGMGDGGSGGDPANQAQRPGTLLGKILRIDVDVPDTDTRGYRIPVDNPFVGSGSPIATAALDEIWSFGVRNPWRFTFDPTWLGGTGAMVIGDVGQGAFEEISYEPARLGGRNYGWRIREGAHDFSAGTTPAFTPLVDPIFEYGDAFGTNNSTSITGGYVYRGTALGAAFRGRYFYADYISGRIASIQLTIDPATRLATASDFQEHTTAFASAGNISSIDIDAFGEIYVVKYGGEIRRLLPVTADTDADGMTDAQELRYGLDPASGAGANGATGDPDGDSVTNAAEIAAGTHPRSFNALHLAEGAASSFFETTIALMNPGTQPATTVLRFLKDNATTVNVPVTVAPRRRLTINPGQWAAIQGSAFATIVESDQQLTVERTMTWDQTRYGAHSEKAIAGPTSTWYFAEGSQGFFLTYLLLTNPNATAMQANVRFLRESGGPVVQNYTLAPLSRRTVDCGSIPALLNTSFGIEVTFDAPGAAERAMYFGLPPNDALFKAGHESAGVSAPATEWFLAEGATGNFFETFVLVANPNAGPADLTFTYITETGAIVTRTRTLAANARLTINIEAEGSTILNNAAVATRVQSTVPVVVERAQYWPFSPAEWLEAHNAFGVTTPTTLWHLAEGLTGRSEAANSYVLLANNTSGPASVSIDFIREVETPVTRTFTVPANSRLSIGVGTNATVPQIHDERFGAVITSSVPIVVERAMYWNANGQLWSAGTDATGTPVVP
jgi:glucose/arabinose dehydrogenase